MPTDHLLTLHEVAYAVDVHVETVRRWVRGGVLAVERVGPSKRLRVRMSVLKQFYPAESLRNIEQHQAAS